MNVQPVLSRITIYPVKSLDGISVDKVTISEGGCLLHDREYAMTDEKGHFINGKSNSLVHSLRSFYDLENETIALRPTDKESWAHFNLQKDKSAIQLYLSYYFGEKIFLVQNRTGRFLDIPDISGATILSTSTLQEVSGWFNITDLDETRRRLRATIEIENVPSFWEDHLFSKEGTGIEFKIGDVTMFGMQPRERCVVPTRNPETGEVTHAFPKSFAKQRASTLPQWSALANYRHYYYLSVDCNIPSTEIGKTIQIGEEIKIIGKKIFH
ncbi:MAG: MOSC N-terminal beta barrel domain-containing protein [Ginsengibacter sp.]